MSDSEYAMNEILVVDDTPANLKLLNDILRDAGYNTRSALDGELALRSVNAKLPALILLDVKMDDMDGYEVCRRLKANERTREIPIIFISVLEDEQAKIRAFQAGGVDYVNKPFSEVEVLARVNAHIGLRRAQAALERRNAELMEVESRLQTQLEERMCAEVELQHYQNHLEQLVAARTDELQQEIVERKRAEQMIKASEEKFYNMFHFSPIAMSLSTLDDGRYVNVNAEFLRMTERTRDEVIGRSALELNIWARPEQRQPFINQIKTRGFLKNVEMQVRTGSGKIITVLWNADKITLDTTDYLLVSMHDLTERKRVEIELRRNETRLDALLRLNQMTEVSVAQVADFAMEQAIRLTESVMGFLIFLNDDETIGTVHSWSKTAMAECAIIEKPMQFIIAETGLWGEVVRQRRPIILNDYAAPHPMKKGFPKGHVAISRYLSIPVFAANRIVAVAAVANKHAAYTDGDVRQLQLFMEGMWNIVRRNQAEEKLLYANAQLQELNVDKDTFFSIIAHDLKNPLIAFLSFADLLERIDKYDADKRQAFVRQFRVMADHLFALLDNLLTWARSQQGRIPYAPRTLPLDALATPAFDLASAHATEKQVRLINAIPHGLSVFADMDMLETVIRNLLNNAIKFTPTGGSVTISAQPTERGDVEVSVSDTGVGIPEHIVAHLFQLGSKIKQTGTSGEKGTGLGLILCKEFVERHGGSIRCESAIGTGSVFRVVLPKPQ